MYWTRNVRRLVACGFLLALAGSAAANYNEECRGLAQRLAADPGSLKTAELDLLKSCLSDLQRSVALGEKLPPGQPLPMCTPAPVAACPSAAPLAPVAEPAKAAAPAPAAKPKPAPVRERPREDDRRLKPYLPKY